MMYFLHVFFYIILGIYFTFAGDDGVNIITPNDNTVQIEALYNGDNGENVRKQTIDDESGTELFILPIGHMKKLGEHGTPIVGELTELDFFIGGKDFYDSFLRQRKPVVFRGVTKDWNSTKHWKNESYLLEHYSDVIFDVELQKVFQQDLNPRKTMDFREFLTSYKKNTWYLDSPFPQSPLMNDINLPLMMQCEMLWSSFTSMHLLYSNGGTSSPLHADGYENFLALFSGQKAVYIIDPKYGPKLYMNQVKDFPGLSPINPEAVDFSKYPAFKDVPFHKVVLEAGDMLYIPQGWYHQVRSFESPNIAASMWFQYFSSIMEADFQYRDQIALEEEFSKIVNKADKSINCQNQNMLMQDFQLIDLNRRIEIEKKGDKNESSNGDKFVNNTILYEKVNYDSPTIFVGSDDRHIYAIDMATGNVKWKVETKQDTGSTCAFNLEGNVVYCGADDGYIRAIEVSNGKVIWAFKTGNAVVSSALVDEHGTVYIGSLDHNLYALNSNGTLKWKKIVGGPVWCSPVQHKSENLVYIAAQYSEHSSSTSNIFALDKDNGSTVWKKYASPGFISSPRLSHDSKYIYFCDTEAHVYPFNSLNGSITFRSLLHQNNSMSSSPAISADNTVYALLHTGRFVALDLFHNQILWMIELGESEMGSSSSPLLTDDGVLYVGGGNGTIYALSSTNGDVIWKKNIGSSIYFSSPRLSKDGLLFIGSVDGPLYALNSRTGNKVWSTPTEGPLVGTALITRGFSQ